MSHNLTASVLRDPQAHNPLDMRLIERLIERLLFPVLSAQPRRVPRRCGNLSPATNRPRMSLGAHRSQVVGKVLMWDLRTISTGPRLATG
jgi:hypothetical protein